MKYVPSVKPKPSHPWRAFNPGSLKGAPAKHLTPHMRMSEPTTNPRKEYK